MTEREHLLICLNEECAEIAQRIDKALRFGINEIQPGQSLTNSERIRYEIIDFIAVMYMLIDLDIISDPRLETEMINAKKEKVRKFMAYAREIGALEQEQDHAQ